MSSAGSILFGWIFPKPIEKCGHRYPSDRSDVFLSSSAFLRPRAEKPLSRPFSVLSPTKFSASKVFAYFLGTARE